MLVAAAAALAYSLIKTPSYEATAKVSFRDPAQDLQVAGTPVSSDFEPEKRAAASAKLVTRNDVVAAVKKSTASNQSISELKNDVQTAVEPDSNLVDITASAPSASDSARLANAFAVETKVLSAREARDRYDAATARLRGRLDATSDPESRAGIQDAISRLVTLSSFAQPVEIAVPAEPPGAPASPKPLRDTIIAAILGLLIGVGLAFVRHALDRRVSEPYELQKELALPLVGQVRGETLGMGGMSTNGTTEASERDLEAFRILRTNLDFLARDQSLKTVAVTSPLPDEGKSTVAAWLAYANAVAGRQTILVECDFRRPVLSERFDLDPSPGLADYLAGNAQLDDVRRTVAVNGPLAKPLPVIPAGTNVFQPTEMIASRHFQEFLREIAGSYELVVIDSSPVLPVGDTLELVPQVDGMLLCVRLGQTTHEQARATIDALAHLPKLPTGLVVTGLQSGSESDYYGYYSSLNEGAASAA
jgi:capsular exopolysaccharide synthesis family protein